MGDNEITNDAKSNEVECSAVHTLRREISGVLDRLSEIQSQVGREAGGRELALMKTKLEEAKMWGGKALGALGELPPEGYAHDNAN